MGDFNPEKQLAMIDNIRKTGRRKAYKTSKLIKFRSELVALRISGGSHADLATWLRLSTSITAERSTVSRFLRNLPELKDYYSEDNTNG